MDELRDARGDPGIGEGAEQFAGAARRFLRRAADHWAAGGKRGGDLLRQQIDGEIPRRKGGRGTDRLADDDRTLAGRADEGAAVVALDLLGVPAEHRRRADHFGARLGERLTLFLRQDGGDVVGAFGEQRGCLVEDGRALFDVGGAPQRPGARGGGERLVEVGLGREGQVGDAAAADGIDDGMRVAALAAAPVAVDEKLQVCVIGHGGEIGLRGRRAKPS